MNKLPPEGKKLNIVLLGSQMEVAGAQKLLLEQAGWFQNQGHKVMAVFLYDKANLFSAWSESYPFPIVNLRARFSKFGNPLNLILLILAVPKFYFLLLKNKFDVIETFTIHSNIFGIPISYLAGIPVRIPTHHGAVGGIQLWMKKIHGFIANSRMSSCMVAVSELAGKVAIQDEGIKENRIKVILNGIPVPNEKSEHYREQMRRNLGISEDEILILSVGRLVEQKGFEFLIQASEKILGKHKNTQFFIAGEGELRKSLEEQVKNLGVKNSVSFLGIRGDLPDLLLAADIYLTTSLWEGLSLALLEAMAAGLPVVTTDVEGVGNVIVSGENGLVVPIKDIGAIEKAVSQLILSPGLRKFLGEKAKITISKNHSINEMCSVYERLFYSFLQI